MGREEEEEEEKEKAGGGENLKTRTPHNDVGKNEFQEENCQCQEEESSLQP